jgi:hypothetical protein
MPTHSKAIREYQTQHAISEALGFLGVSAYVGVLTGIVYQLILLVGVIN